MTAAPDPGPVPFDPAAPARLSVTACGPRVLVMAWVGDAPSPELLSDLDPPGAVALARDLIDAALIARGTEERYRERSRIDRPGRPDAGEAAGVLPRPAAGDAGGVPGPGAAGG